jgi:tRNA(Arg) A34 adenosine deaminase TadA
LSHVGAALRPGATKPGLGAVPEREGRGSPSLPSLGPICYDVRVAARPKKKLVQQAVQLALEGVRSGAGPFGALVVKGDEVVGRGVNRVTSTNDPTAHAEIVAIREACQRLGTFSLAGHELYATCEPCPMCLAAAYWARVDRVVYACDRNDAARAGFDDAVFYQELEKAAAERKLALVQLGREEALAVFQAWLEQPDRKAY